MYSPGLRGRSMCADSLPPNPVIIAHYCFLHLFILLCALITTGVSYSSLKMHNKKRFLSCSSHLELCRPQRKMSRTCIRNQPRSSLCIPPLSCHLLALLNGTVLFMLRSETLEYRTGEETSCVIKSMTMVSQATMSHSHPPPPPPFFFPSKKWSRYVLE